MTVIGIDDTDSRELGMCTTYVAATLATAIADAGGTVTRSLLVRLNPAIEHKTRGNAALAIHADIDVETALELGSGVLSLAAAEDPQTNPGIVISDGPAGAVHPSVVDFSRRAVREYCSLDTATALAGWAGYETVSRGTGRGLVGALAAVGAWEAFDEWTYETIAYRERKRWGTARQVTDSTVFEAAASAYPAVWDTADHVESVPVCVPRTPCPILYGIRGDDPAAVEHVTAAIESEPVASSHRFLTNQGTDAHLQSATLGDVRGGRSYRVDGTVSDSPETRQGGHVFLSLADGDEGLQVAAFEPTKRFRDRVRSLRTGDRITACGEVSDGTLKLEKFAVRDLRRTEQVTPDCSACGRSMESAGRDAGYRCRDCDTSAPGRVERECDRDIEPGWYEVPPCARRHIAKPLVRGGFDAPVHPER